MALTTSPRSLSCCSCPAFSKRFFPSSRSSLNSFFLADSRVFDHSLSPEFRPLAGRNVSQGRTNSRFGESLVRGFCRIWACVAGRCLRCRSRISVGVTLVLTIFVMLSVLMPAAPRNLSLRSFLGRQQSSKVAGTTLARDGVGDASREVPHSRGPDCVRLSRDELRRL